MDGTGIPVVLAEIEGRAGKFGGQPAHTREVKPGCVFGQTTTDARCHSVRDDDSTTYVGAIETAEQLGLWLYTEAWARMELGRKEIGARRWRRVDLESGRPALPGAIQIVDLYHAHRQDNRGLIRPGMKADLTIFDAATVADKATFDNPYQYAVGVKYVVVNGKIVIDDEKLTSERPGEILYGPAKK